MFPLHVYHYVYTHFNEGAKIGEDFRGFLSVAMLGCENSGQSQRHVTGLCEQDTIALHQ